MQISSLSYRTNKRGGGVAIIIRECFTIKKTSFADSSFANFECLNCIVSVNEKHPFIGIVYRPPHSKSNGLSKSAFFEEWEDYLNNLVTLKHEILLTGDINFHLDSSSSPDTKKFLILLDSFNFCQHINSATHICGHTLDFVATLENSSLKAEKPKILNSHITDSVSNKPLDYFAIIASLNFFCKHTQTKEISFRNLKNINYQQLSTGNVISEKLESLPTKSDVMMQVQFYNDTLTEIFDHTAPVISKKVPIRKNSPWYDDKLRACKRTCRKYERLWRKSGLTIHKLIFQEQCALLNKMLHNTKKSHIQSSIGNCKNVKKLYKVMNKLLKSNNLNKFPSLISSEKLPDEFVNFFKTKIDNIHTVNHFRVTQIYVIMKI